MNYTVLNNGWYQIAFEIPHEQYGIYRDAIVLSPSDYASITEDQVEAMKQGRFNDWVAALQPTLTTTEEEVALKLADQFDLSNPEQRRLFRQSLKNGVS